MLDHNAKNLQQEDHIKEYSRELQKDVLKNIDEVITRDKNKDKYRNIDFYVCIHTKMEKIINNVPRNFIFTRMSCPTPVYGQVVFKYVREDQRLDFLWVIPMRKRAEHILAHPIMYYKDPNWKDTADFVHAMASGVLDKWVQKENGYKQDALITQKDENQPEAIT